MSRNCCHATIEAERIICHSPMIRGQLAGPTPIPDAVCDRCPFENVRCGETVTAAARPVATPPRPAKRAGPGTELKRLFESVGIRAEGCGGCGQLLAWMNDAGPDECERSIDTIKARLLANRRIAGIDWKAIVAAAARGALKMAAGGLPWLNPFDPLGSIIRAAIAADRKRLANDQTPPK